MVGVLFASWVKKSDLLICYGVEASELGGFVKITRPASKGQVVGGSCPSFR